MVLIICFVSLIYYSFAAETQETQETGQQYYRISMVSNDLVIYSRSEYFIHNGFYWGSKISMFYEMQYLTLKSHAEVF